MCATQPPINDLAALDAAISGFNRTDLLSAVAGLQLLPENAERIVRLEALAYRIACGQSNQSRKVPPHSLRELCNSPALGTITHAEDPFDSVFCEEMSFHGGSYRVLPGINEHATFILKRILESLFFHRDNFPDREYVKAATQLIHGTLALSEQICAASGITRNPEVAARFQEDIVVPNGTVLARLKGAVRFSREAFCLFLRNLGLPVDCLRPLTATTQDMQPEADFQISGLLSRKPIVAMETDVVVASPTELVASLRNALIALAQDRAVTDELAERFGSATWQAVREHLSYVNCDSSPLRAPDWHDRPRVVHDGFLSLDTDKIVYCVAVTDSLSGYDRQNPFGHWETPGLNDAISARLDVVAKHIYAEQPHVNEILLILLTQSVGRFVAIGVGGPDLMTLALPAADLCTLCLLEGGKDLVFWKFALVRSATREQAFIAPTGMIDEYQFYRKNRYTFYASDDYRPNAIWFVPGGAGVLRREVFRQRDWHGVHSYEANRLVEVTCLMSPDVPVYSPSERPGSELALLVEGLPMPVWVTGSEKPVSREQRRVYAEFVDAIAYWLWQFAPAISPVLHDIHRRLQALRIVVELNWDGDDPDEPSGARDAEQPIVVSETDPERGVIVVKFEKAIEDALATVDNAGERLFVNEIMLAIRRLTDLHVSRLLRDHVLANTIDTFAPLGLKKKIFFLNAGNVPQLDGRGLPRPRPVQEVDKNLLLDPIGDHFRHDHNFAVGPIDPARTPAVINEIVSFCFQQFTEIVTSLSPEGLLEWIVLRHESNVSSATRAKLLIATRIACFGQSPEFLKEISESLAEESEAAVAGRFLIEYVAACPPKGFRPMSLSVYDALLARAAIITTYGMLSDIVHFQIARVDVDMLGAGRLGFRPDQYRAAMQDYRMRFAAAQATQAANRFRRQWQQPAPANDEWRQEVETATLAEFGFPLSKLVELLSFAIEMGLRNPPIVRMRYEDAVTAFAAQDGWDRQQVETALEMFLYRPRDNFLKPGNGYRSEDVYLWRYGRRLSYLRRPFLLEELDGTWLVWGHRHMKEAHLYLLQTCFGGRMQATSDAMKELVSRHANREGEAFNDGVADRLANKPALVVHRRLNKIGTGKHSIQSPGDIDVLVIDEERGRIYVLECKNLAFARTPFELAAELRALTETTPQHRSMIEKHKRRVVWLKANLDALLAWAKLDPAKQWEVRSAVLVDEHAMSPKLQDVGEPVFSIDELREDLPDFGLEALCTVTFAPYPTDGANTNGD
jgi:hypothetical protein